MLRTNLSTRPFYNERVVYAVLGLLAVVALGLTVFNVSQIVALSRTQSDLSGRAATAENRARDLRAHAVSVRQGLNPKDLDAIVGAASEANSLIGQRLFSWTELLNRLETTLPDDVRITSMRPTVEKDGSVTVALTVVGRRVDDIDRFMQNLEETGKFIDVFSREEVAKDGGLRQASVEGRYLVR